MESKIKVQNLIRGRRLVESTHKNSGRYYKKKVMQALNRRINEFSV